MFCPGIHAPSSVTEYLEAVEDLPDADRGPIEVALQPVLIGDAAVEATVEGTAFYALQSCINHSCQPNCHAVRSDEDNNSFAVVLAKQFVPAGDEITISYIDEALPYEERQAALLDYGFKCRCTLCQEDQGSRGSK